MRKRIHSMESKFDVLPEGCIANILSWTTPLDAARLSLVSKFFYSASQADIVWDRFLPSDLISILSRCDQQYSSLITNSPSKKSIYVTLCENPIIIDNATKSFQLDKRSGKKCYMLGPRTLDITGDNYPDHWGWRNYPESRFPEVAVLNYIWVIEIHGAINIFSLSPRTNYAAYLVFKLSHGYRFRKHYFELSVRIADPMYTYPKLGEPVPPPSLQINAGREKKIKITSDKSACLRGFNTFPNRTYRRSRWRRDGWLEIEIGSFYVSGIVDDQVHMAVLARERDDWMGGLIIQGIEVRPKEPYLSN